MKLQLACSLVGLLCGSAPAVAEDPCQLGPGAPSFNGANYYDTGPGIVSELASKTPDEVRTCILSALVQQRASILDSMQQKAKDLADVDALIERWKKKD